MIYRDRIIEYLAHLSDEKVREVLDFVELIRNREKQASKAWEKQSTRKESIVKYAFCGMWKDREDMKNSFAWVRQQREKWNERLDR